MTEVEAKTKWCPMFRIIATDEMGAADNRGNANGKELNPLCLASSCMMWVPESWENGIPSTATGRCGLAK